MSTTTGTTDVVRVTVGVPTFRRPDDLRALLPLLLEQAAELGVPGGRYAVDVLVVDNDPAGSAAATVAEFPVPQLRYAAEPRPGIAAVRNRALDEAAGSQLLAMIDDDELPLPGWLDNLVRTWEETRPAAVSGRVLAAFQEELDPWVAAGEFFRRRSLPTGTEVGTAAAGNLMLDVQQVRERGLRFETGLGLSGGEDTLFSRALVRTGGRIVWCDESAAVDQVPAQRMTRRWVLTRAWSHGNASMLTDLRLAGGPTARTALRVRGAGRGLLRLCGGALRWAWGTAGRSHRHQARGLRTSLRGAGMLCAVLGIVYLEYARPGERRLRLAGARLPAAPTAGAPGTTAVTA
ncbi:glycosyltransferase family 2 protein [Modestobacter sp. SSW1-42]|uniref:glycosyltransferase family 2 protein n=1 Tax=Modestobacter sp. SSW1-42 TaxID=596372 RepID=UPI0039863314